MEFLLTVLAILGFAAVLVRFFKAALGTLGRGVDVFMAREAEQARARRGDITGLAEARDRLRAARQARRRSLAEVGLWFALLIAPPLTPWTRALYAGYSVLWLFARGLQIRGL